MGSRTFLGSALAILFIIGCTECLNLECAKEQKCFKIENKNTVPLNLTWIDSIRNLYYPLMSRLDLYKTALTILQKDPEHIREASIYYESCFDWNMYSNGTEISRGFNGLAREYKAKLFSPNMEKYWFGPVEGPGFSGIAYTTMTDNKTYFFFAVCGDDGEMSWGVGSILPALPEETIKLVHEHAESLGFKREYFTEFKYDGCDMSNNLI